MSYNLYCQLYLVSGKKKKGTNKKFAANCVTNRKDYKHKWKQRVWRPDTDSNFPGKAHETFVVYVSFYFFQRL